MAIFHCSIKIIGRNGGRSAVASAAYRSGEKLYNEETGITHDFTRKGGVVLSEILLPDNAPTDYHDRQTLWNEVQKIEKRSDAQLAREVEVALPAEMTRAQQIECVRAYIQENFTAKGMIADWAFHDKGDGNPHAHIMLTVRGIDGNAKWQTKQRSVFANARDEQGSSHLMTQRTRRTRHSTASLSLTGTAGRRQGCVRARERNISGSASRSLQTTGTNTAGRRNGGSRGRNTVTVILRRRRGSTTVLMKGRDSTLNPPYTRA